MKKIKEVLLFVIVLVLLVGVATANEVSTEADTPTSDTPLILEKAVQEKSTVSPSDTNTVENIKQKTNTNQTKTTKNIQKNTNNLKKDTTVSSWIELNSIITDATQDTNITLDEGTYTAEGTITFNQPITITIDGKGQSIDGNQNHVFEIERGSSVILKNITIKNSKNDGWWGAILNGGNLIINNSTLINNTVTTTESTSGNGGGAIHNYGKLTITDSTLENNQATGYTEGGAIFNMGTLTITQSNLNNNTATGQYYGYGGAISNSGNLNITGSNLTHNKATGQTYDGWGGAIYNYYGGNLTITESNLNNNTVTGQTNGYGGAIYNDGTLNITQSNLTYNRATGQEDGYGGAISNDYGGTINIDNSILEYNNATHGGAIYNHNSNITLNNTNLTYNNANDYGGAIVNNGTGSNLTIFDSNLTHNKATGQEDGYGGAIYNNGGTLNITQSNLTQNKATGQGQYGYGYGGAIHNNAGTLNITQSNLTQNKATGQNNGYGGAIYNSGNLTINNSTLKNNTATGQYYGYGGAIYNAGTLNITQSNLTQNNATGQRSNGRGGAIYNDRGTLTITQSNLTQNNATGQNNGYGGAIHNSGNLTITDSNLTQNNATGQGQNGYGIGGAIHNTGGTINITQSNLTQNKATGQGKYGDGYGGVIGNDGGTINITQSNLTHNTATGQENGRGGAIYNIRGNLTITQSNLNNNTATGQQYGRGGAIYNLDGLNINNSMLEYNNATQGGAIYNTGSGDVVIESNYFIANPSQMTGTAIINDGTATIKNNEGDETSTYNGTIYTNSTKTVTIEGNKFYDKLNITINISTDNAYPAIGDVINITFTLKDQLDRPIIDENITITIKDYTANKTTDITGTTSIEHTIKSNETLINATYPGNNNYNTNTTTLLVTAPKIETKLIVDDTDTKVGQNFTITGTLLDKDNQPLPIETVNITVNGTTQPATTNNLGQFNTTFTLDQMGEYPITVIYPGTDVYTQSTNSTAKVTATKTNTKLTLTVSNNTPVNNTPITITVTLTDTTGNKLTNQNITLNIADKTFNIKTNSNGVATQTYTPTKVEKQTITAIYNGNSQYVNSTATTNITVKKINTKINLKVSNTTPVNNTPINITVTLTDTDGNKLANQNITLNVSDKTFNIKTNNNGIATQSYTPTTLGKQTITATYNGNSQYVNSTATTGITVKKINTKLSVKVSNSTPVNNTSTTITATLTDTDNKTIANQNITLNVAGKTFNLKTNSNGIATQTYTPTTLGKQTITAIYKGDSQYVNSTATTNITVKKINTKIDLKVSNNTPINNTPITVTVTLTDADGNKLANQQVTLNINGKTVTAKTNNNGQVTQNYTPTKVETQNITATYTGDSRYNNSTKTIRITVKNKIKTQTTVNPATGVIGEKLTIKATITDTNGNNVKEGNLIFKVNGVTIKDNGKLTGSNNPLKIKVVNGVATATIIPDINMTNAKNITAYYVGTTRYNASTSGSASINISKRNATIEVTTNKKIIKQGQVLIITAKIYDTTNGKKTSNITKYQDEYVYFKVNGITLKDANGEMLKVKIINGTATVNYTIPLGISCLTDMQTLTPKNHTIQVGLYNKNYQNIMTKTPTFQVERSNITINLANATINNKTHTLSMKITIKDYLGNIVAGPNKCIIKVNGVTLKNGTNVQYYYTTDGVLNLKNIPVPQSKNYTSIEVITQDRLAYNSQRNTTKVIKITN
ncbi:Ig-like domain repeat protein [Methanosphaera sp. BMS]|uniref:beta strand repeat-containing protein n=1 Tax=Methanosphaera sp. BMS TaxID=1789762 RepID=UPI000DC1EE30|nr:Ig-like domain repeat protein [Methanosphaera sp. BMS]AWX32561.1 hypothetical protein AW729_05370 [Methanosphaera sp. BMS]